MVVIEGCTAAGACVLVCSWTCGGVAPADGGVLTAAEGAMLVIDVRVGEGSGVVTLAVVTRVVVG